MLNFPLDRPPTVTVLHVPHACSSCGGHVGPAQLYVVADNAAVTAALDRAMDDGESTAIDSLDWVCASCAIEEAVCSVCGGPLAGMVDRPWIIDGGHVVGNPFWPDPPPIVPRSCLTESCAGYAAEGAERFHCQRGHAVGYQGFPDAYQGLLADLGVER